MNKKLETWCYGGASKAFYMEQSEAIHQYNTKMLERLLVVMTIILGCHVGIEVLTLFRPDYFAAYSVCFATLLAMLCSYKLKAHKSIRFTKIHIFLFFCVVFSFVCILGTVLEPNSRAIMFIVYLLALPMLFVLPTHYTYSFLITVTCIFFGLSLGIKDFEYARMDIANGITCLVIGLFISHHILESRMALYAANAQLDTRNVQLDKQLQAQEIELLQGRISIMLTQIQPHFLYNALTAICGLCDTDPKEAKKVTAQFSDYLRHNLDSLTRSAPIPFELELCHTKAYLAIEQKRFNEKLNIVYDIQTEDFHLPSLTMQPIAENAVKHGAMKRPTGGTVTIATQEQTDCYEIIITDDGVGFDPAEPLEEPDAHIGIQNVRSRLWSMCGGTLTITSKINDGTVAIIQIPKEGKTV